MLGITLEIDKKSVDYAAKRLNGAVAGSGKGSAAGNGQGIGAGAGAVAGVVAEEEGGKGKGSFLGGLLGGLFGALLGTMKPIKEILEVIGGILTIMLVPVLQLMRPFLVLFLKVGIELSKWLSNALKEVNSPQKMSETGQVFNQETINTPAAGFVDGIRKTLEGWVQTLWNMDLGNLFGLELSHVLAWFANGFSLIFIGALDIVAGLWDILVGIFTLDFGRIWAGFKEVVNGIVEILIGAIRIVFNVIMILVAGLGAFFQSLWNGIVTGFNVLLSFGSWIWDKLTGIFSAAFSVLSGIGSWIWDKITSFFGGGGGGGKKTTKANDALITSAGDIVQFNPNDNILAFQDFKTVGGLGGGQNIQITVNGFVGDEDLLAERISKALNNRARGSTSNF